MLHPIDFAYAVHTKIGDTAIACEINGKDSPLQSALQLMVMLLKLLLQRMYPHHFTG